MGDPNQTLEAFVARHFHDVIDDRQCCCDCGDDFEEGELVVYEPVDDTTGGRTSSLVAPAHGWCAIKNKWRIDIPREWWTTKSDN